MQRHRHAVRNQAHPTSSRSRCSGLAPRVAEGHYSGPAPEQQRWQINDKLMRPSAHPTSSRSGRARGPHWPPPPPPRPPGRRLRQHTPKHTGSSRAGVSVDRQERRDAQPLLRHVLRVASCRGGHLLRATAAAWRASAEMQFQLPKQAGGPACHVQASLLQACDLLPAAGR